MNTNTTQKAKLTILAPRIFKLRSDSGNTYGIVRGTCGCMGFRVHKHCRHVAFIQTLQAATVAQQSAQQHLAACTLGCELCTHGGVYHSARQRQNARMAAWLNG